MKRILLILSVMLIVLPAMAAGPTNPTYYQSNDAIDNGCSTDLLGDNLGATDVTMVAQYTPICPAGQYSDTSNDPNGVCTACSGTGKYCPGMTAQDINLDSVTGLPDGDQGIKGCPTGYTDGAADENSTTIYACQKQITKNMCNTEANNFRNGTMSVAEHPDRDSNKTWPLMVNYRDVDNHCYDYLECNAGHIKKNVYEWIKENPQLVTSWISCGLGDTSCAANLEPGTAKVVIDINFAGRPMNELNFVSICSDLTADALASDALNGQSVGANCYVRNIDFPDQPWVKNFEFGNLGGASTCAAWCGHVADNTGAAYPFVAKNVDNKLLVKDTQDDIYAVINGQFVLQTQNGNVYETATGATPLDSIGEFNYVLATYGAGEADYVGILNKMAELGQTADVNYNDADDDPTNDNPVKVCVPREVTITWIGVEEPYNVTKNIYNSELTVPSIEHTPKLDGYTFEGWTVGPVNGNNGD